MGAAFMALSVLILTKVDPPPRATAATTPAMVREKREVVHVSNQHDNVAADDYDAVATSDVRRRTHVQ